jgi:hypothetical protein
VIFLNGDTAHERVSKVAYLELKSQSIYHPFLFPFDRRLVQLVALYLRKLKATKYPFLGDVIKVLSIGITDVSLH